MAYLGRGLDKGNYLKLDDLQSQFNGSTTTFNLTSGGTAFYPGSAFSILVSVAGIVQEPESAYQINQNQIIFATAPLSSDDFFCIVLGVPLAVGVAGNSTITGTQLSKPFNYNDGHLFFDSVNNRLGINSTTPRQELDVLGNAIVSGIITATGGIQAIGIFSGGTAVHTGVITALNFVGTGNTFAVVGNRIDVSISGGSGGGGIGTVIKYADNTNSPFSFVDVEMTVTSNLDLNTTNAGASNSYIVATAPNVTIASGIGVTVGTGKTIVIDILNLGDL